MTDRMKTQMDEFIAGDQYARALQSHNMTPVVDDDYPEVRHRYEAALRGLIEALRANGRIELSTPSAQSVERVAQPDGNYAVVLHPDFVDAQEAVDMARGGTTVILQKNIPPTPSAQADKARGEVERIGELIRTQDNRITSHPIFVVEQKRMHVAHSDYDHDRLVWVSGDGEATAEDAARLDAEYADTGETPDGWRQCAVGHSWEFVTACFTEQGCKDYLAANGHNLSETRIFVYSGWRNAEWQAIRAHLSTTPQPQGDATPSAQVSGGGEVDLLPLSPHIVTELEHMKRDGWRHVEGYLYAYARACVEAALSTPQARPEVRVNFPQVGTAGPFSVIDGAITLPDETMNDLIRHARTGYVPAPTADGGEAVAWRFWVDDPNSCLKPDWSAWSTDPAFRRLSEKLGYHAEFAHPAPAQDAVARLVEEMDQELEMFGAGAVAQLPTETLRDWRNRLAPFTAAQQDDKP